MCLERAVCRCCVTDAAQRGAVALRQIIDLLHHNCELVAPNSFIEAAFSSGRR